MTDWETIVRQNGAVVVNAVLRVIGNAADAEDVSQEVFIEAFERFQSNEAHHWTGLLRRMAICRSVDFLRKKKAMEPFEASRGLSAEVEPCEMAIARELEDRLRHALTRLTKREAEVFCLHYFEGLAQAAIAKLLAIQPGAVAAALHKARIRLEAELQVKCTEDQQQ